MLNVHKKLLSLLLLFWSATEFWKVECVFVVAVVEGGGSRQTWWCTQMRMAEVVRKQAVMIIGIPVMGRCLFATNGERGNYTSNWNYSVLLSTGVIIQMIATAVPRTMIYYFPIRAARYHFTGAPSWYIPSGISFIIQRLLLQLVIQDGLPWEIIEGVAKELQKYCHVIVKRQACSHSNWRLQRSLVSISYHLLTLRWSC